MGKAAALQSNGKRSPLRLTLQRATTITTTTTTKAAARGKPQPQRVEEREQNDFSMKCSTIQFTAKLVITPAWSTTPTKNCYRAAAFLIPHTYLPQPRALQNITKNCCQRHRRVLSLSLSLSIAKCKMYLNLSPSTTPTLPPTSPALPSYPATQRGVCAGICCGSHVHG